ARLCYGGAGAEVRQLCRIGGNGAGLLRIGPGLLVGVLARLLIRPLLLLLRLLRIRGLAASRREGSRGNDCNDRQFRKCDMSSVLGLLTPIPAHAWPFSAFRRGLLPLSAPTYVSPPICPETAASSKMACRRRSGRAEIRLGSGRDNPRTLGYVARGHQATRASGDWLRPRSAPQISSAVAASATGNTISFTALQPKLTNTAPEANEPSAIEPKTRKSLKACTLFPPFGRWQCV